MKRILHFYDFKHFPNIQFSKHISYKMPIEDICRDAREIFNAAVNSVKPEILINKNVEVGSDFVQIQEKKFHIDKNVHVIGFGKAVLGMSQALENKLKNHIVSGIISIPEGMLNSSTLAVNDSTIKIYEGASNNIPDEKSLLAAIKISELVSTLKETDLLFVLISGGGSALLPAPKHPISLQEKQNVIKLLSSKGATIEELNAVRKKLSNLKGGGLAKLARPAKVVSLILSDIINDPICSIASGPTTKNTDTPDLALKIIEKYKLKHKIPISVLKLLEDIQNKDTSEHDSSFSHVHNFIIGNNQVALEAAACASERLQYDSRILTNVLTGEASYIGRKLISMITAALQHETKCVYQICNGLQLNDKKAQVLLDFISELKSKDKKLCLLLGGETTVEVNGTGLGGRNQELALASAIQLNQVKPNRDIVLLAAGTDGIDGPTTAAGAIATTFLTEIAEKEGLNPTQFLNNNDSFNFYSKLQNGQFHVKIGHTGTNVMDIIIILIK